MKNVKGISIIFFSAILLFTITIFNNETNYAKAAAKLETPKNFSGKTQITEEYETNLTTTWDEVSGADGYEVYCRSDIPGEDTWDSWYLIKKTTENTAQGGIIDGCFQMKVRAYKGSVYSDFTDVITVLGGTGIIENPIIKISATKKTIYAGSTFNLFINNAADQVTWKSNNSKIASVSSKGNVKGLKSGTATITATHRGKNYICKVTVKAISKKTLAINGYKKFLLNKLKSDEDYSGYYYALDDLTGDGIPELFIGTTNKYWVSFCERFFLYTFKDGKVKALFTMGEHEGTGVIEYDKANKYYLVIGYPQPTSWYTIYKYDGKRLKKIISTDDDNKLSKYTKNSKAPDYLPITIDNLNKLN